MNILDKIVADKRVEVDLRKSLIPMKQLETAILNLNRPKIAENWLDEYIFYLR